MHIRNFAAAAALTAFASTAAIAADSIVYNGTPADGWHYGSGNGYSPANTEVLSDSSGDQLYLRWHVTGAVAPASSADGTYAFTSSQFNLPNQSLSFDWGFDQGAGSNVTAATLSITDIGAGHTVSYNAFDPYNFGANFFNDNYVGSGSTQNSARLSFSYVLGAGFNPALNDTYQVALTVTGLAGGTKTLSSYAKVGTGAALPTAGAVPEPASWAMMLGGFGLVGGALRRRNAKIAFA